MISIYLTLFAIMILAGYFSGQRRAIAIASGNTRALHSLPSYHGMFTAAIVIIPMLAILLVGFPIVNFLAGQSAVSYFPPEVQTDALKRAATLRDVMNLAGGRSMATATSELQQAAASYGNVKSIGNWTVVLLGLLTGIAAIFVATSRVSLSFRARNNFEKLVLAVLIACSAVAILTTIGIVASVVFETYRFFFDPALKGKPTITEFLFGLDWNPQAAMRAEQGNIQTAFGFVPLLVGTLLITIIAMAVAVPTGLLSAIYLSEYAGPRVRAFAKPALEILAGIPTVVLGFFAALVVAPSIKGFGESFGLSVASESALAAGLVMGMMIIPFISSLSDDVINAVPQSLRDGSYAMGATKSETMKLVILPAALPGIVSAIILAFSRAIGETMIVVMAAGLAANLTVNPLSAVTTITVQIKTILVGDQEFDSAKTLAAFALGFVLFFVTLILNYIALRVVQKYREQYD
jgi:phosphate transport system permease protein